MAGKTWICVLFVVRSYVLNPNLIKFKSTIKIHRCVKMDWNRSEPKKKELKQPRVEKSVINGRKNWLEDSEQAYSLQIKMCGN